MNKSFWSSWGRVLVLAATALALTPRVSFADDRMPVEGSIQVSAIVPSATDYCAGSVGTPIEAQGVADISGMGPVYVTVKKCLTFPSGPPVGTWTGTLTLRASNGDTLTTAYTATEDFSLTDSNGFTPGQGTVRVTGGTGGFTGAGGVLSFTFVQCPSSTGAAPKTVNAAVFYLIQGSILFPDRR
jgi:hypothetical protein